MFHTEIVPTWLIALLVFAALLGVLARIVTVRRNQHRSNQRRRQRSQALAYQRAWDWVMGRRLPRLTDERSSDDYQVSNSRPVD